MGPNQRTTNYGIVHTGGTMNISGTAVGPGAVANTYAAPGAEAAPPDQEPESSGWDVGVITVLPEETRAVVALLRTLDGYAKRVHEEGARCHEATTAAAAGPLTVVSTQAAEPGQRSVIPAFETLQRYYNPVLVVLVGIAGGIHPAVGLGDVVIANDIVYYDMRKDLGDTTLRRGRSFPVPAVVQHAVNEFLAELDQPVGGAGAGGFRVHCGPIGSGEAVVAGRASEIRDYLRGYNDKVLAVETEAGGLAQAFHEAPGGARARRGWLVVRGVSDHADRTKDDRFHAAASANAAAALGLLLPYLKLEAAG